MSAGWTIVLDVGKTFSKASLCDECGQLIDQRSRANASVRTAGYLALDLSGIETWLEDLL